MEKKYLIAQPPAAEKFTFLVDEITDSGNWGIAKDIDKINYNRRLFEEEINIDIEIKNAFSQKGVTFVFSFGRFIVITELRKDFKNGRMTFFDFQTSFSQSEIRKLLGDAYSDNVVEAWLDCLDDLNTNFSIFDDIALLQKPYI